MRRLDWALGTMLAGLVALALTGFVPALFWVGLALVLAGAALALQ